MDFSISEESRLLTASLRRFVEEELQPLEGAVETKGELAPGKAREIFLKSRDLGFYAMNMPEEVGGGGLGAVEMCLAAHEMGRTSDILVRRAFGTVYELLLACTGSQRDEWLLPAVRGDRTCAIAMTEPGAGSDAAGIKTSAKRDGCGWVLNGGKHFVSDGVFSDFFAVTARTDPDKGARGISVFLVDKAKPGVTVGRNQPMMGLRGGSHVELSFEDVKLGSEHLLGEEGRGLRLVLGTIGRVRLFDIGARAVGTATLLLEMMTRYANERKQFGVPIGHFQMVQAQLADSAIDIASARLLGLEAAWDMDRGLDPREKVSMVKVYAAEVLGRVADRAVQIFGGLGYCKDLPIERIYRDCRVMRIYDGTSEIHRGQIAKGLLRGGAAIVVPTGKPAR
jgi:acyl-CoA dehydrogenase